MRCLYLLILVLVPILVGCGSSRAKHDPNRDFIVQVESILWNELRRDELTSKPVVIKRYRDFGLRVKAIPDVGVNPQLAQALQEWAAGSIELSNVLVLSDQIHSNDDAIAEDAVRLLLGEAAISVWERASLRATAKQRLDGQLEVAHARLSAGQADFYRIKGRLFPETRRATNSRSP